MLSGQVTLVISPALAGELARVLAYPELGAIFDDPPHSSLQCQKPPTLPWLPLLAMAVLLVVGQRG